MLALPTTGSSPVRRLRSCLLAAISLPLLAACATPIVSAAQVDLVPAQGDLVPAQSDLVPAQGDGGTKTGTAGFQAPEPKEDKKFDWIRLTSGEWLKGEIDVLRKDTLEFDSDKLDDLKIDWDDVAEVRTAGEHMVLIEGADRRETYVGRVVVKDGVVSVDGKTVQRFDRKTLIALVPGTPSERNYWSGKLNFGLTTRSGNTSQTDFSSYVFARRQNSDTRWDTTYNGAFSKVQGTETQNTNRLSSRFDVFLTRRLYVTPIGVDVFRDRFQNIELRTKPFAGFGYDLVDRDKITWNVSLFGGYERTEFVSVQPGESDTLSSAAIVFATTFEWDPTSTVESKLDYNITVPTPQTQRYNHHLSWVVSVDVIGDLDLDVTFVWDRQNQPLADGGGNVPEKDDYRVTVGIGYSF